ncbi:MAG: leucine-rich repeat protein, partial [Saccharofermentans sp.]|nr:leucine-rich repeat protein [Saccharofermentans sp.]
KVTMPDSVSYVGDYAFIYCDNLKNVKLSDSIRTIGASTFEECYSLTTVTLSDDVFSIGKRAFYGCGKLKNFDLPSFAGQLGDEAFYGCKSLTEINLSDYTFKLGNKTFCGCTNLKKVTFPSTLGSIGNQTFYHCESLTGIEIPKSVTSIGEEAFCGCKNLKSIVLPDRNLTLGKDAFTGSDKLASVVMNKDCYSEDVFGTSYAQKIFHYYYDVAYKADGKGNIFGDNRSYGTGFIEFEVRPYDGYVINKITLTVGGKNVNIPCGSEKITYKMPDSNDRVTISATFAAKKTYNVIVNSNLGGTAFANVHSAAAGETISITTAPYDGYKVGSMTLNGASYNGKPFKMPANDVTIEVTFVKAEYTVSVTAGNGGTASVDKTKAVLDDIVTITATPEDGYGVDKVKVNGVIVDEMTFQMGIGNTKVEVTFKKLDYTITVNDDGNGTASVEREWANKDDEINITVKPDDGYMLDTITVNGEPITGTKFTMPAADVTIEVTFKLMEYPVTVKAGEGGTAQVSKTIANVDDVITITVKPDACFELDKITVNGAAITGNTFTMPAHKVEVEVTFKAKPHMILPVKYKAPTCEEDGYEAHYKCCICGKCYNDEDGHDPISGPVVLTKLGHDLEKVEAKDPTKNDPGNIEYYRCKRDGCGKLFKDAKGKEPITLEDTVIPAIGHELEHVPEVPATCEKPGHIEYYKCTDEGCDKMFRDKFGQKPVTADEIVIPATGHSIVEVKEKAPTCEEDGYKSHFKCEHCGQLYSDAEGNNKISAPEKIDKLGHDLHKVDAKAETYLKDGNIEHYECSRCHKLFSDPDGKNPLTLEEVIIPKKGAALLDEETVINNLKYKVTNPATDGTGTVAVIGNSYKSSSLSIPAAIEYKEVIYKVVSIGSKAFNGNKSIKTVSIGSNVTSIGDKAFYGCSKLTKVSGGSNVRTIGSYAFASCSKLKSFSISSKYLSKIGSYAFKKDKKLKTVSIKSTTSLTKAGVKKSLKSSYVKTVKVAKSKVKTYKKYFKKSNSGRSVTVKK